MKKKKLLTTYRTANYEQKKFLKKLYGKNMFPMDWREITGFVDDWKNFFAQRCAKSAHPQAQELATNLRELFKTNKLI